MPECPTLGRFICRCEHDLHTGRWGRKIPGHPLQSDVSGSGTLCLMLQHEYNESNMRRRASYPYSI